VGADFSTSITMVSTAIHSRFIVPSTNINAISAQD
jgi:hypothetical protein